MGRKKSNREKGDERILGSGSFVSNVLHQANKFKDKKEDYQVDLEELVTRVAQNTGIEIEELLSPKRERRISYARGIVCYLAVLKLGYKASEVGKVLGISRKSVSRCLPRRSGRSYWGMRRGEKALLCREIWFYFLMLRSKPIIWSMSSVMQGSANVTISLV